MHTYFRPKLPALAPSSTSPQRTVTQLNRQTCATVAKKSGLPPQSLALVAAMNDCWVAGPRLPPVTGRNCGLVQAWRGLVPRHGPLMVNAMAETPHHFGENLELFRDILRIDPLSKGGFLRGIDDPLDAGRYTLPVANLMFWMRPHAIIEPTDALERLLVHSDLGDDLPLDLFRPPFPACFIRFGKAFRQAVAEVAPPIAAGVLQGVYVFESQRNGQRRVALVPVTESPGQPRLMSGSLELIVRDEAMPMGQQIRLICGEGEGFMADYDETVMGLVAKVFLYMSLVETVQIEEREYTTTEERARRLGPKKAARFLRLLPDLYDRYVVGPESIHLSTHGEVSAHMRRGHFRMQPHGPQLAFRKVIFIAPTWVRADKLGATC